MNIIKVKDYDSMQAITVSLAKNGYLVTADSVTDEHYKEHWEIKYCELSEITEKQNNNDNYSDFDGDYLGSMEINNKKSTKGVKSEIVPDEKSSVGNDSESKPVIFDLDENDVNLDVNPLLKNEEKNIDPNLYKSVQKHKKHVDIPIINQDVSNIITDEPMTVITSVSGN